MGMKGASRCPGCKSVHLEYQGVEEGGAQKWRCKDCGTRFTFRPTDKPVEKVPVAKAS